MCGLVGVMGKVGADEKKVLAQLLAVDILRGRHSTGIATVNYKGDVNVVKKAMNPDDFFDLKTVDKAMKESLNCIIGHNRYATKGKVNNTNAHPFEFSHTVGAHNGTLWTMYGLDDHLNYEVDSECLYNHINNNGIDDAFDVASGALALTWYDSNTNQLYFLRNKERPMCYCFSEDKKTLFWASEWWMLEGLLWRNNIKHTQVVFTEEDVLYTFDVPKGAMVVGETLKAPHVRKLHKVNKVVKKHKTSAMKCITGGKGATAGIKPRCSELLPYEDTYVEVVVNREAYDDNNQKYIHCLVDNNLSIPVRVYCGNDTTMWSLMLNSVNLFKCRIKSLKSRKGENYLLADLRTVSEVVTNLGDSDDAITAEGYNGEKLTYTQFKEATSEGCSWCTGNATFGKPTLFINRFDFFCDTCLKDSECQEYLEGIGQNVN